MAFMGGQHNRAGCSNSSRNSNRMDRSEEHTSELQSLAYLVCRLLLEKKKKEQKRSNMSKHPTRLERCDVTCVKPRGPYPEHITGHTRGTQRCNRGALHTQHRRSGASC